MEGTRVFESKSFSLHGKLNDHKKTVMFTAHCIRPFCINTWWHGMANIYEKES